MPGGDGSTRPAVLDASVAVRWVVTEVGSDEAAQLLDEPYQWLAPRLMLTELASALRRKVLDKSLSKPLAMHALDAIVDQADSGAIQLAADEDVMRSALIIAFAFGHKLPDCVYLALAERSGADLITADRQLARLAEARFIPCVLLPSA